MGSRRKDNPADDKAEHIAYLLRNHFACAGPVTATGPVVVILEPDLVYVVEVHTVKRGRVW